MINTAFCFKMSVSLLVHYLTKEMDVYLSQQPEICKDIVRKTRNMGSMHHKPRLWMGDEVHQSEAACGPVWLKHKR